MNNKITEITMNYLTNKEIYHKYINCKLDEMDNEYEKEKQFYKKRINNITRNLMKNNEILYPKYILNSFDNYIKDLIEYLKIIDKNDIIQEDYIGLNLFDNLDIPDIEFPDSSLNKQFEITKTLLIKQPNLSSSLDNFVKITKTNNESILTIPQQKNINLNDPSFKSKGISY
jgi:hypothetical protein